MKNYARKFLVFLLLALMILPACQMDPVEGTTESTSDTEQTGQVQYDEWGREMVYSGLPEELDYDGATVTFLSREAFTYEFFVEEDDTSSIVNDAIFRRNTAVEDELNVTINVAEGSNSGTDGAFSLLVQEEYLSGDGAYDVVAPYAYYGVAMITGGYFYDLCKVENLNLDSQWWNQSYREVISVADKEYAAVGDIVLSSTSRNFVMFFNKQLLKDTLPDYNIYDIVRSGEWTLDEFVTLTRAFHKDDGDGIVSFNDTYGFVFTAESGLQNAWEPALGIKAVLKDGDDVELNIMSDYNTKAFDALFEALCNNEGVYKHPRTSTSTAEVVSKFTSGSALMTIHHLDLAENSLTTMEDDFGIVPIPKYSAEASYQTTPQDAYSFIAVMGNETRPDMIGATLECMAYESYMKTIPAYYEVAMKNRYLRTDETTDDIDMYDIIMNSVVFDFGVVYANNLNNVTNVIRGLITRGQNNYTSSMKIRENSVNTLLSDLIEALNEIE